MDANRSGQTELFAAIILRPDFVERAVQYLLDEPKSAG
jgi:hypothetical protein